MFIFSVPVAVKVLGSLVTILIFSKFFKRLYIPIFFGTIILALWSGFNINSMGKVFCARMLNVNNLFLMLAITLIIVLSNLMRETGIMKELVANVRCHISQRAAMAVLPAIIGFLPMPGGAIFSAPLVDDCDHRKNVSAVNKSQINYWFRHIWEYWWPLYPGVLLAIEISGLSTWQFMLIQLPFCIVSICCGYFFLLRKIPREKPAFRQRGNFTGCNELMKLLLPIATVVGIAVIVKIFFPQLLEVSSFIPIVIGLCFAIVLLHWQRPVPLKKLVEIIFSRALGGMLLTVFAIQLYGGFISSELPCGGSTVMAMRQELFEIGIPVMLIIMIIPFISGFTTGIALGFVGASFPIVFNLLGNDPSVGELLATNVLAFGFGYMGMILSPVHVCLIVSNQHFKTTIASSLQGLIKPAAVMLVFTFIYYFLLSLKNIV